MKLSILPEGPLEALALWGGVVPVATAHTLLAPLLGVAVLEGHRLGVLEALADGPAPAALIADRAGLHPTPTASLLEVLRTAGYLRLTRGSGAPGEAPRYALTNRARRSSLARSSGSIRDQQLFNGVCLPYLLELGTLLRTGRGIDYHDHLTPDEWALYQRSMRATAGAVARIAARTIPRCPPGPGGAPPLALDVGGGHGLFAEALCRRQPGLRVQVLDLPQALETAVELWGQGGTDPGPLEPFPADVRTVALEPGRYGLILISSLLHHFDEATARGVVARLAPALAPGGSMVIQDFMPPDRPGTRDMAAALLDLFYQLTSTAGNHTLGTYQAMMTEAGLKVQAPRSLWAIPGARQLTGQRSP